MTKLDEPTLKNVRDTSQKLKEVRVHRASDFLTDEEQKELRAVNLKGRKARRKFDEIDAYVAEIMARFGWDAYQAWGRGEITTEKMNRLLYAERARDKQKDIPLISTIVSAVSSCVKVEKGQPRPRGIKQAGNLLKREFKMAKGEF